MKNLPIDVSTFRTIIEEDYVYIDKTESIFNLFNKGNRFYFLSRPRRFGKSLLISTLKELFSGNRKLFKNLWIEKNVKYDWIEYPVIHLDFSAIAHKNELLFEESLSWHLSNIGSAYGIDLSTPPTSNDKLSHLIIQLAKKNKVVVLIDEYDYPLLRNLESLEMAKLLQGALKDFYSTLKSLDAYLRAIFITGVSKFSKTSVFSGLNNINDITLKPQGATLLGYTELEIVNFLKQHLIDFAKLKNLSEEEVLNKLRYWYNGYRFSEDNQDPKVYNPFSVLYCLQDKNFKNYWFQSGTPYFLTKLIQVQLEKLEEFETIELSAESLGTFELDHIPIVTVLFQTGYLTIHEYDVNTNKYILSYPNFEVKESFKKYLIAALSGANIVDVETSLVKIKTALEFEDIDSFCETIKGLFANIPYPLYIPEEKYFHSLFQFMLDLIGMDVQSEIVTNVGRIDLVISLKNIVYVFEIKFNSSSKQALKQIFENRYYEKYMNQGKKIILVGLSFVYKNKLLTLDWIKEEFTYR